MLAHSKNTHKNMSDIQNYLKNIHQRFHNGIATEHTYRGDLQNLLTALLPDILTTNEPSRIDCGAPDYVLTKNAIPVGYIEAKDLGADLNHKSHRLQFERYKAALNNIIFTNYLDFDFYRGGEFIETISLGYCKNQKIIANDRDFERFVFLLENFATQEIETIKNASKLAGLMANKAKLLSQTIYLALESDEKSDANSTLWDQMKSFKQVLIHDITTQEFADIYAQTIAYGMFAARFHDPTLDTFSRQEAADLIPKTNPFLRKLFGYIASYELDDRIVWIIDALAHIFKATNVKLLLKNFGKSTRTHDPIIHFYETFLSEYDPSLRKSRGVWYTPEPVVDFIVRAVDDVLKSHFHLPDGLADTSKTKIKVDVHAGGKMTTQDKTVHKVQILDPATGTGTFLAQVIKQIYTKFTGMEGIWRGYVEKELIPRLNGFEILMASYAMAHLKLDMLLAETGYQSANDKRFQIYLTNALEEAHQDPQNLFARWLTQEADEANHIKRQAPVMCIIGNPPYSGESQNKGDWIMTLMEDYKKEPNSTQKLQERNPKWINDDYVKFLRYGQHFIEKNNEGVLAFICPHGFLDNPTFRGMRYNLLKTYDTIYTIDLHGNAKKKETCPDGTKDDNVFDIQQGVSINIFVKTGKKAKNELAQVLHYDLYGKRQEKYDFLTSNDLKSIPFVALENVAPNYFMVPKDFEEQKNYDKGFSINEFMPTNSVGIVTGRDNFVIDIDKDKIINRIKLLQNSELSNQDVTEKYKLKNNNELPIMRKHDFCINNIQEINYRVYDKKYIYYHKDFIARTRHKVMQHFIEKENWGTVFKLGHPEENSMPIFISKKIIDFRSWSRSGMQGGDYIAPLYLYPDPQAQGGNQGQDDLFAPKSTVIPASPSVIPASPSVIPASPSVIPAKAGIQNNVKMDSRLRGSDDLKCGRNDLKCGRDDVVCERNEIEKRTPNFDAKILKKFTKGLGLTFISDHDDDPHHGTLDKGAVNPLDILDYIYAVLHSPKYRETYKAFLKIDFPKIPYPTDIQKFWQLVALGREIRLYHLLEHPHLTQQNFTVTYPIAGDNIITTKIGQNDWQYDWQSTNSTTGRIMLNSAQYFDNIPVTAWEFYIGGYQPAQKWLKDRKGRTLSFDDIQHYQKMIHSLMQTHILMQKIDIIAH